MRAAILEIPRTPEQWAVWGYAHRDDHQIIRGAIQAQGGPNLPQYDIDPVPFRDPVAMSNWLERNQLYHDDMDDALNLQGSSLIVVDFDNPEQARAWANLHYQEHVAAGFKLEDMIPIERHLTAEKIQRRGQILDPGVRPWVARWRRGNRSD